MSAPTVILVHGIFDTGAIFHTMSGHLGAYGIQTIAPDFQPNDGSEDLRNLAETLAQHVAVHRTNNDPVFLVGFSMGGLICRYYMQRLQGHRYVDRWVTISTPHHGTLTAYAHRGKGAQQMRIGSSFLDDLNNDVEKLAEIPFLSLWTPFDLMILPAGSSRLSIGTHKKMFVLAHPLMNSSRRVIHHVKRFLVDAYSV